MRTETTAAPRRPFAPRVLLALLLFAVAWTASAHAQNFALAFGGPSSDRGRSVAMDASGNVVVTGHFFETADFDPGAGVASRSSGGQDVFVARYDASGAFVSVATFGGTNTDIGYGVAVDASGNAVVTGYFRETVDFDPSSTGTESRTSAGLADVFVVRYAPGGTLVSAAALDVPIGPSPVTILGNGTRSPRVRIEGAGAVRAEVFDVLGRSVGVAYDGAVSGTVEAPLPGLAVGSYVVRVVAGGRTTMARVVVR